MSLNNTPRSADRTAARLDRSSDAFPWRIATAMLAGYLLATVPQVILDPQLKSHVTYVKRYYPFAYLIIPIAIIVFTATVIIARFGRRQSRLVTAIPFIAGCALSAPIFRPEVPHGNLVF